MPRYEPERGPSPEGPSTALPAESVSPADVLERRKAFLSLTEADLQRVHSLGDLFRSFLDEFVEQFYKHLFRHPVTAALLQDPQLVARLKQTQKQYFENLVRGRLDPGYVEDRWRIGSKHAEVGLEPQWFLGAYNQYIQYCFRQFGSQCSDLTEYVESTLSLMKVLLLDMGLALDAYFAQSTAQLRQALEMLAQSNTELKEFARLASHDLKTPLATVAGYCEEFLDEFGPQTPPEGRALIEAARARTVQLSKTIGELLAISEAVSQPNQRVTVSMRRLFDEVLERLHAELSARPTAIRLPDQMPDVHAHPGRVHEVFYNLLSNAIKFMDKTPGLIEISVESQPGEVIFCVSDNGPGIPEIDLPKIFAPFRRLSQHKHQPGSGLGLYFVKMIVEEQGGRVWVESNLGEGSRFCVALPAAR